MPIASLTKIMTALLVVDETKRGEKAKITKAALAYSGSGVGVLPKGKKVPVDGLLAGLLLPSGNDAAIALADHVAGNEKRFVGLMNRRARKLGLHCTQVRLAARPRAAQPLVRRRPGRDVARWRWRSRGSPASSRKKQVATRFPIKGGRLYVNSTNPLLRAGYKGTIGLKTGTTDEAGHCFVGVVRRGKRELGVVLLHSPDPGDARAAAARRGVQGRAGVGQAGGVVVSTALGVSVSRSCATWVTPGWSRSWSRRRCSRRSPRRRCCPWRATWSSRAS